MGAEMEDIILSWGHNYLTYNTKCVESPGEAVPNNEIFRRLAARMGFEEERFKWSDSECLENFVDWDSPACEGFDLDYLREHGYARLSIGTPDDRAPHKEGNFPTPSGKCEFKLEGATNFVIPPFRQMYEALQSGEPLDSLPDYVPNRESAATNPELAKKYPLNIISPKSHAFLNSCYANMESKLKAQTDQYVILNPADAEARGVSDGDPVRVFNDRGEFEGNAQVSEDAPAGVVVATLGYWRQLNRNGTVNIISSAEFVNMGHAPTFSDNLVQVALTG
jgi:anaerobic selenocysteine-containing dehydrogenase